MMTKEQFTEKQKFIYALSEKLQTPSGQEYLWDLWCGISLNIETTYKYSLLKTTSDDWKYNPYYDLSHTYDKILRFEKYMESV